MSRGMFWDSEQEWRGIDFIAGAGFKPAQSAPIRDHAGGGIILSPEGTGRENRGPSRRDPLANLCRAASLVPVEISLLLSLLPPEHHARRELPPASGRAEGRSVGIARARVGVGSKIASTIAEDVVRELA